MAEIINITKHKNKFKSKAKQYDTDLKQLTNQYAKMAGFSHCVVVALDVNGFLITITPTEQESKGDALLLLEAGKQALVDSVYNSEEESDDAS